jgi:hypothetical protein
MRGRRPSPLDDSGARSADVEASKAPGVSPLRRRHCRPRPETWLPTSRRGLALVRYLRFPAARGCGGIGRRARFRSVSEKSGGGSSPLIRILKKSLQISAFLLGSPPRAKMIGMDVMLPIDKYVHLYVHVRPSRCRWTYRRPTRTSRIGSPTSGGTREGGAR